jgi:hypothetical protein
MNQMTRQSVINTVYAELRRDGATLEEKRPSLRVCAMLYELGVAVDEVGVAAQAFGDLPKDYDGYRATVLRR